MLILFGLLLAGLMLFRRDSLEEALLGKRIGLYSQSDGLRPRSKTTGITRRNRDSIIKLYKYYPPPVGGVFYLLQKGENSVIKLLIVLSRCSNWCDTWV